MATPSMTPLDPRTPVIVGVGQQTQKPDDLSEALEAAALMRAVVEIAAEDSGAPDLTRRLDAVAVVDGAWRYSDPARLVADWVGSPQAKTIRSYGGGNTPQSFVNLFGSRIQAGELDVVAIVGAETIWSRRRQRAAGIDRTTTIQDDVEPDERPGQDISMSTPFEKSRGLEMPIHFYPIFESSIRAASGRAVDEHRAHLAELWARFNAVAVTNPHAWVRTPMSAAAIGDPGNGNRMVGFPYTKAMNSNWDLDQGAALILCSVAAAEAAGVARDRWVFPLAGTDAHDTYAVSRRRDLHSSPAIEAAGARLFELTDTGPDELDHVDLYSCFPSAVQIGASELGLSLDRQLTVTGGLPFAGGPLNNYVTHSIATMVDVLRNDPGSRGLITANGGYTTKHALGLYSTAPSGRPFMIDDVQSVVDRVPATSVDESFTGAGIIEAATVMHDREGPEKGLVAIRTPTGARTWAFSVDPQVMGFLMTDAATGALATVRDDGTLHLTSTG